MGAQGTTQVNFGAFPGASDASVFVAGQPGILSSSLVEAWIYPLASADHSADEHVVETITITAGNISAGNGFTIYAVNNNTLFENPSTTWAPFGDTIGYVGPPASGRGTRLYGNWTVAWCWN